MKRIVLFLIVAAALLAPSAALASGVVLKVQKAAHLVAVTNGKKVSLVHSSATARLKVGERVTMKTRTLRNGTLAASAMRVIGRTHKVHFRGLLLKRNGTRMMLSAGGAIIAVNRGSARTTSSANDTGPQPGATVDVTATVGTADELDEDGVSTVSAATPGGAIEGKLTLGTGKITVVSDHMALVINVPATFDLSKFANGDEVLAKFTQDATTGALTLTDLSGDDNASEADSNDDGDDNGDGGGNGGGGDNGGGGGGGDD